VIARGAQVLPDGQDVYLAFGQIAVLSDPFGNGFCLLEFAGRGYDEVATA